MAMALVPILFLVNPIVLAHVSWPNIGMGHSSRKAPTEVQEPYWAKGPPKAHQSRTHNLYLTRFGSMAVHTNVTRQHAPPLAC